VSRPGYLVSATLAAKLASVVVHADELLDSIITSPAAVEFDKVALATACRDPEVQAWLKSLGALAPQKRR